MELNTRNITQLIEDFLWHCRFEKNLDMKTIKAYQTDLKQFSRQCEDNGKIEDINKHEIKSYLQRLSSFEYKTIKRKLATLRAMLNYCECEYEDFVNPMRKMQIRLREPIRLPKVMTIEEVTKIFKYQRSELHLSEPQSYKHILCVRNIAILELLFASGIRIGELCNLRNKDIDLSNGVLHILGKGNKERIIYICQSQTLDALISWNNQKHQKACVNDYFFTNRLNRPLSTQSVRLMLHQVAKLAHINKTITPHMFRHTFATLLLEEDVDIKYIQSLLGHSSIVTTQIYTHVNPYKQKEMLITKHPRRLITIEQEYYK